MPKREEEKNHQANERIQTNNQINRIDNDKSSVARRIKADVNQLRFQLLTFFVPFLSIFWSRFVCILSDDNVLWSVTT